MTKSHQTEPKLIGYQFKLVNLGLWFTRPSLQLRFGRDEKPLGKAATRRVFWSRLICSSGLRVDVVTPLSYCLPVGEIILVEMTSDPGEERDPEIELARVESTKISDFGFQLIKYKEPVRVGKQCIRWAVLEGIWNTRRQLVVRGRGCFHEGEAAAKHQFEQEARCLAGDELIESHELTRIHEYAETGKWRALKDIHPKTVAAIERVMMASNAEQRDRHRQSAADEFGKEFYALRKQIIWPVKGNATPAISPLTTVSAAERKSIGRRKPRPNPADRYMATGWISKKLASLTAAQLARHLNDHFKTGFTAAQIRTRRHRLGLIVPWTGDPQHPDENSGVGS